MLSTAAFNALLKTMEEPPEHVKFVLCTTDPQKVPATIQSRCQRFDFRAIPSSLIGEHLASVVQGEGVKADRDLIAQVARLGNGSMRDALSLLDRLMATGSERLTSKLLEELLGLPERARLDRLLDAIANGDARAALEAGAGLLSGGVSVDQALEALLERLRDLLVLSACGGETELVDLEPDARREEAARAERFDAAGVSHMIALTENVQRSAKSSALPRALFDALLVRLALAEKFADAAALLAGGGSSGGGARGSPGARAPARETEHAAKKR